MMYHVTGSWLPFGWSAVDLFFVLSGYLITGIILRSGGAPGFLRTFYVRRGLRTWPIYYLTLAVMIALSPLLPRAFPRARLPYLLTYTQGLPRLWAGAMTPWRWYLAHFWSLAVEEQFYLVWPAPILLIGCGRRRVAALALACAAASALARGNGTLLLMLLPGRADGLALGALLATLPLAAGEAGRARDVTRVGLGLLVVASLGGVVLPACTSGVGTPGLWASPGWAVQAFNLLWVGFIGLVAAHPGHPRLRWLRARPLRGLGLPPRHFLLKLIALLALAASVGVAAFSWRFIERPLLNLKDRFAYRPAPAWATPGRPAAIGGPMHARRGRGSRRRAAT